MEFRHIRNIVGLESLQYQDNPEINRKLYSLKNQFTELSRKITYKYGN